MLPCNIPDLGVREPCIHRFVGVEFARFGKIDEFRRHGAQFSCHGICNIGLQLPFAWAALLTIDTGERINAR